MKAIVFAAGRGTRLKPLTDTRPKALVEIDGVSLLEITLRRLATAGTREVIVNTHHFADQMHQFIDSRGAEHFGLWRVAVSEERELLDTGGGLKKAAWFFEDTTPFLAHNVDVLSDVDLAAFMTAHTESGALATLAAMPRETERPLLFDERGRLVGRGTPESPKLVRAVEGEPVSLGFCGIHAISPEIFSMITEHGAFSIIDAYLRLAAQGARILAGRIDGAKWRDCGRREDLRPL
ncbi:MAG TPA: sugar phosphate nucleotidyltransferase [Opitutaceae bacterium]|nr:sugar phosphate nucleotidyltransferase [Opitutaceae bacterium]